MSRGRWAALVAVLVVLVGAVALNASRGQDEDPAAQELSPQVVELQGRAQLQPCPTGFGPAFPDVLLRCLGGGEPVQADAPLTTGPTVVNVWGSWCPPCREEMPHLRRFAQAAQGRVALVGVDTADTDDSALSYAAYIGMRWPSLVDPDAVISTSFGPGVPKTILLGADGRVVHVERGEVTYDRLVALVSQHLGVRV